MEGLLRRVLSGIHGFRQLLDGAPGWRELISVGKVWQLVERADPERRTRTSSSSMRPRPGPRSHFSRRALASRPVRCTRGRLHRHAGWVEALLRDPERTVLLPGSPSGGACRRSNAWSWCRALREELGSADGPYHPERSRDRRRPFPVRAGRSRRSRSSTIRDDLSMAPRPRAVAYRRAEGTASFGAFLERECEPAAWSPLPFTRQTSPPPPSMQWAKRS